LGLQIKFKPNQTRSDLSQTRPARKLQYRV